VMFNSQSAVSRGAFFLAPDSVATVLAATLEKRMS